MSWRPKRHRERLARIQLALGVLGSTGFLLAMCWLAAAL